MYLRCFQMKIKQKLMIKTETAKNNIRGCLKIVQNGRNEVLCALSRIIPCPKAYAGASSGEFHLQFDSIK